MVAIPAMLGRMAARVPGRRVVPRRVVARGSLLGMVLVMRVVAMPFGIGLMRAAVRVAVIPITVTAAEPFATVPAAAPVVSSPAASPARSAAVPPVVGIVSVPVRRVIAAVPAVVVASAGHHVIVVVGRPVRGGIVAQRAGLGHVRKNVGKWSQVADDLR